MVHGWPNLSSSTDNIFFFIIGISLALLLLTSGVMVYFVVRYNRKRHPKAENVTENTLIEIVWTIIPTILVLAIFWVGWKGFVYKRTVPKDAMLIKVTARMWSWNFRYENGLETSVLKVPADRPIKLSITSADVLHSLFIPAFRVKEDCVPGIETYLWFLPEQAGSFDLFCTEYCGVGHSGMITKVEVMPQNDFEAWYSSGAPVAAAVRSKQTANKKLSAKRADGAILLQTKGCLACHTTDGAPKIGPTLKGIFGRSVTVVTNGKEHTVTSDEAYIRKSLLTPQADIVKGFPPIMPSQKNLLTYEEIDAIIEHLKTLK